MEKLIQEVRNQQSSFLRGGGVEVGKAHNRKFWDAGNFLSIGKCTFWMMCRYKDYGLYTTLPVGCISRKKKRFSILCDLSDKVEFLQVKITKKYYVINGNLFLVGNAAGSQEKLVFLYWQYCSNCSWSWDVVWAD